MYYILRNNRRSGPFSKEQLKRLATDGALQELDLVMRHGEQHASLISELPELDGLIMQRAKPSEKVEKSVNAPVPRPKSEGFRTESSPENSVKSVIAQILSGGKFAAAFGTLAGFIGDFLEPLAPMNGLLFLGALLMSIIFGCSWLSLVREKRVQLDRWFPQQCCIFSSFLVLVFGGFFLLQQVNGQQTRGVLGGNVAIVAQAQNALLQIGKDVGELKRDMSEVKSTTSRIQEATEDIADTTRGIEGDTKAMRIETTGIHADTSAIRDSLETIGRQRGLVATPSNAADYYHNAMVHVRDGNHAAAEESFHAFFKLDDGNSFDAYIQYAKLVLGNYAQTRAKRLLGALAQNHPENLSAQVVMISETAEDDEQARTLLTKVIKEHGSFLPAFVCLKDRMPTGLLIDDIARDELRGAFRAAGGVEALKSFVLNPAEGEGRELLQNAKAFESEMAFDPMDRLIQGVQIDPNITLLWLGVDDPRPGREIVISFPGGVDVRLPLDSPDNPATEPGANGVLRGVAPGASVALELPRYVTGRKARTPAFKPRDSNDVRIFPHAGELEGVEIDPNLLVAISYVDNKGRRYRFPKQVKLFGEEENGGGVFAVEIERRDSFDPTPVLQITPANSMSRVEVSGRAEGPFVPVPEHMNLPTMNEIACANVPFFAASSGSTKVWVRGTMENGEEIASLAIDLDVPPAVRWKTRELVSPKSSNAQSASSHELKFEPPDQYSDFYIDRLVFSPGGDRVAAMMERAGLVVWDVKTGRQTHLLEANTGKTLLFSADGARLTNGQVIVDLATSRASPFLQDSPDIFGVAVSQTFSAAATVDRYQRLAIYDSPFSHVSATVDLAYESVAPQILAVAPSADLIAVAGIRVHSVRLVDRAMGKIRKQLDVPYTGIASVAFSPDGKELLAVGSDSCVRLWNLATFTDRAARIALEDTKLEAFWTSNGMPLVAEHGKAGLTIYDAGTGKLFAKIDEPVKTFAISPTGTSIAIAKKTTVVIQRID